MTKENIIIIVCFILIACLVFTMFYKPKAFWQGMPVKQEPIQVNINNGVPFKYKKATITPLADYTITGVVIDTKRYFFDETSSISPIDVLIVWKKMSVADVINDLKFVLRDRHFIYNTRKKDYWPIQLDEAQASIANNHCIPANDKIKKQLLKIKKYNLVTLKGQLVSVQLSKLKWVSSLSRTDNSTSMGFSGCEVLYVTDVKIEKIQK